MACRCSARADGSRKIGVAPYWFEAPGRAAPGCRTCVAGGFLMSEEKCKQGARAVGTGPACRRGRPRIRRLEGAHSFAAARPRAQEVRGPAGGRRGRDAPPEMAEAMRLMHEAMPR